MNIDRRIDPAEIASIAAHAAFGRELITNVHRGMIAEAILWVALEPDWEWCSADYAAWDFQRADGVRLELKQAASRQSWHAPTDRQSRIAFDIRAREGRYDGNDWLKERRRWADIYVFAHHHVTGAEADHRNPAQWLFHAVLERQLPLQETITLSRVRRLALPKRIEELAAEVAQLARALSSSPL